MFTYVRHNMFLFFVLLCLLNTGCYSIQSDETNGQSAEHKRLLLNDPQAMNDRLIDLERKLQAVNGKLQAVNGEISSLKKENSLLKSTVANIGGVVYIRWGRKDCPILNGTQLVYSGIAGGGAYIETGSGTSYLCLPHDPDFAPSNFPHGLQSAGLVVAHVWGAEYQFSYGNAKVDDDVPCAACLDTKAVTSMMIPGKSSCPAGWRKQYSGYLCANHYAHPAASEYACVDDDPQYFEGRRQNSNGKLFYPALTVCGSLPCPPYVNSKYLTCVVCSK